MGCFLNQDEPFGSLDVATQPPLINQHISHTQQHPFANHSKLLLSFARRPLPPSSHPTHIHTFHTAHIMHHHHHHHSTTTTSSRSTMQYPGTDLLSTSQDMLTSLDRSAMALNMIAHTLENEFEERFGHTGANPLEVAKRLRKLQRELPALKQECQSVLQCKQELVDSARRLLDANTSQLQQLCERSGFTQPPDDQGVHEAYGAAVKDWEGQMLQRCAGLPSEGHKYTSHSLNQALASARLQ